MKYLDEYRDGGIAARLAGRIAEIATRPWVLMEVCGGQTHSIVRYGIDRMIPETVAVSPSAPDMRSSVAEPAALTAIAVSHRSPSATVISVPSASGASGAKTCATRSGAAGSTCSVPFSQIRRIIGHSKSDRRQRVG